MDQIALAAQHEIYQHRLQGQQGYLPQSDGYSSPPWRDGLPSDDMAESGTPLRPQQSN